MNQLKTMGAEVKFYKSVGDNFEYLGSHAVSCLSILKSEAAIISNKICAEGRSNLFRNVLALNSLGWTGMFPVTFNGFPKNCFPLEMARNPHYQFSSDADESGTFVLIGLCQKGLAIYYEASK